MDDQPAVEDERPARRRRLSPPADDDDDNVVEDVEDVEAGRSAPFSVRGENSVFEALDEAAVSGSAGSEVARAAEGSERREAYLTLLRQVAELPAPVPDEDGHMLSGMMSMVRMGAITAILGLKARRRVMGGP